MDEQLKIILIIIVSVSIFGILIFVWVKNMVKDFIFGKMDLVMMVTGMKTELKVKEFTNGKMDELTQELGKIIICKAPNIKINPK